MPRLLTLILCATAIAACRSAPAPERRAPVATSVAEPGGGAEVEIEAPLLEGLGDHRHAITTESELAQRFFDQGLMLHFGFNHAEAIRSFREAARLDESCGACLAFAALSMGPNINEKMDPRRLDAAREAIEGARERARFESERERAARGTAARADRDMMRREGFGTLQHYYSIPYYALVSFGRWDAILEEPAPAEDLHYPRAVWRYARGMALAATGRADEARRELAAVRAAAGDPRIEAITIWDINSTAELLAIAAELLAADIAASSGQPDEQIAHLRRAVELEDALDYDEPPPWGPATRRYLGAALLAQGRAEEAEEVYRADLERFPENGWSLWGLIASLRNQGEMAAARTLHDNFRHAWRHADVVLTSSRL